MITMNSSQSQYAANSLAQIAGAVALGAIYAAVVVTPMGPTIALFAIVEIATQILQNISFAIGGSYSQMKFRQILISAASWTTLIVAGVSRGIFGNTAILVISILGALVISSEAAKITS